MMEIDVMEQILNAKNSRSKGYRAIAEYLIQNTQQAVFMTAAAIGKECKVSESTVVRFASELDEIDIDSIYKIYSEGPSSLSVYAIHQIEPIVRLMNCRAKRVMFLGDEKHPSYMVQFEDGRLVQMHHRDDKGRTFRITSVAENNKAILTTIPAI